MEQRSGSIGQTVLQMVAQKWFTLCYQTIFCPALSLLVFCGQTVGRIKRKLGMVVGLQPQPHCVRWGASFPPPKKKGTAGLPLSFHVYCGQTAGRIKMPLELGMELGLGPAHIVLDRTSPPKKGLAAPRFSAHVYCGQTAAWIKMPLGREIGLGPGDSVRWGPSFTPQRSTAPNSRPKSVGLVWRLAATHHCIN